MTLDGQIEYIYYIKTPFSDHSAVYMKIRITNIKTGRGIWKMNVQTIKQICLEMPFIACGMAGEKGKTCMTSTYGGILVKLK